MKGRFTVVLLFFALTTIANAQSRTRQDVVRSIAELNDKITVLAQELVVPADEDTKVAAARGLTAVRLLRRGMLPEASLGRGGGAYYSFSAGSHSYNKTPEIELQGEKFLVGFAGADYGFLTNLGRKSISELDASAPQLRYMSEYRVPRLEKDIRAEYQAFQDRTVGGIRYQRNIQVVEGHAYLLRAVSISEADILVGFDVLRIDEDGSVIIAYKKFREYEKPEMLSMPDPDMQAAIDQIISARGFRFSIEVKDNVLHWRGPYTATDRTSLHAALIERSIRTRGENLSAAVRK